MADGPRGRRCAGATSCRAPRTPPALAGAAASLPLEPAAGRGRQARGAAPRACPPRQNMPIDHFVVLMMENRSFDHYFGWLPNADGVQQRTYLDPDNGNAPVEHPPRIDARTGAVAGLRTSRTPTTPGTGGRAQLGSSRTDTERGSRTGSWPATTTSSRSATTTRATSGSSTRRAGSSRSTTASTAR